MNAARQPASRVRASTAAHGVQTPPVALMGARVMFDTSALLKRYASEAGHQRVLDVFAQADRLFVAAHCQSEVAAALLLRQREACLPAPEFERVWAAVRRDIADMVRVALDDHVERYAFAAMEQEPMRVTDALTLGSALAANVDLFVTTNRRLAQVAQAMGVPAEWLDSADGPIREHTPREAAQA